MRACLKSPEGQHVLALTSITAATVLLVAQVDAQVADRRTGRGVTTAHETAAAAARVSVATVRRARSVLQQLGLSATVLPGRYMTTAEREDARRAHGHYQRRFASVRALVLPRQLAAVQNEHLPRRGENSPTAPKKMGTNARCRARRGRSAASQGPEGPIRPLPLQRLAAKLAARVPWMTRGRHIGALCDVLAAEGVDPHDWTAGDLLAAIDQDYAQRDWIVPAGFAQRNPLGLLRTQLRRVVAETEPPQARRRHEQAARADAQRRRVLEREQERREVAPPERVREYVAQMRQQLRELRQQARYATS